ASARVRQLLIKSSVRAADPEHRWAPVEVRTRERDLPKAEAHAAISGRSVSCPPAQPPPPPDNAVDTCSLAARLPTAGPRGHAHVHPGHAAARPPGPVPCRRLLLVPRLWLRAPVGPTQRAAANPLAGCYRGRVHASGTFTFLFTDIEDSTRAWLRDPRA